MFAKPTASRGKNKKGRAEKEGPPEQFADILHGQGRGTEGGKRQLQRATKAQRKAGDMRRGADYEVEDVGGMYGQAGEVKVASSGGPSDASSSEDAHAEGALPGPASTARGFHPLARSAASALAPTAAPRGGADGPPRSDEDDEVREIEAGLRGQLREWASDPGMPEEEKRHRVRQLLGEWHPDKNQHMHSVATRVFQFIQAEVNRIISELSGVAFETAKKEAEAHQRKAQRMAEKSAKASALKAAREDKLRRKGLHAEEGPPVQTESAVPCEQAQDHQDEEWSLVIGHGPATTSFLRPWPRSHFSLVVSPLDTRSGEILLFGGEAYDGRELTFYSDLYRLNLLGVEGDEPLPWEKLYASVPLIPGPEARSAHQAFAWDRWLYVFGGEWSSRDQKRYRQFGDCWRFEVTGCPGVRWECVRADAAPCPRSGHRMSATSDGCVVLFGGFSEDRRRRATYLADCHMLDLQGGAWRELDAERRGRGPPRRSGHLLWVAHGALHVYGGARTRKGAERLEVLEDLWRAPFDAAASSGGPSLRWEPLPARGEGPGQRTGLCQCAASRQAPGRRIVFGGVRDLPLPRGESAPAAKGKSDREISFFHNDVFLIDCEPGVAPIWSRLWPAPGAGIPPPVPALDAAALPPDLLAKGGGVDAQALVVLASNEQPASKSGARAPRGRIAAGCVVVGSALWVFGGSCESGPRQEVTLDDLWRIELKPDGQGQFCCSQDWECVLPLSERATVWFDSESDDDEDDEEDMDTCVGGSALLAVDRAGGVLSKKQQKEEAKKARMEIKREKQAEKCEEKTQKREAKKERQRQEARAKAGAKGVVD